MNYFTKPHALSSLRTVAAIAAALAFGVAPAVAQQAGGEMQASATGNATGALMIAQSGESYEIKTPVLDRSVVLSGEGAHLIIAPGVHAVNGDMTISGADSTVTIAFDEHNRHGEVKVDGKLDISSAAYPMLALDLEHARLTTGNKLILFSAKEITGVFSGTENDQTFDVDGYKLKIGYSDNSIWLLVVKVSRERMPTTPIVRIDVGLIDPTSTSPEFF